MLTRFHAWRKAKVRCWGRDTYIRFTPDIGFAIAWFPMRATATKPKRRRRIRAAKHHGLQMTEWRGARWVVIRQIAGRSTVKKEAFDLEQRY